MTTTEQTIWVRTEPELTGDARHTGRYVVTLSVDPDHSTTLRPVTARSYADHVLAAATRATYEAAIGQQIRDVMSRGSGYDEDAAVQVIADLRSLDRRALKPVAGIGWVPGVTTDPDGSFRAFLTVERDGNPVGQVDPAAAVGHASAVAVAISHATLDGRYYDVLRHRIGIDEGRVRAIVGDLATYINP